METPLLLAALLSAMLHAGWNAAIKASAAPAETMAAQMTAAALIGAAGLLVTGLPPPAAWPWIACSTAMNTVAVGATLRAYREGGFGTVYPIARATSVLVVAGSSAWLVGEQLGTWAALGVGCVATVSYALILWVYTRAPIAPAAALRDTSAVFAMLIAVVWLKEPMPVRRLAVVALALAGVPLLRLG